MIDRRVRFDLPLRGVSPSLVKWTARLIWRHAAVLLSALIVLSLVQGLLPAAMALALRELVNAAVLAVELGSADPLIPWITAAFALAATEALSALAQTYVKQRLHDDLNLEITGEILLHAWSLDLAFFEDPDRRDLIHRTQASMATKLVSLVEHANSAVVNLLRSLSLLGVLVVIEPVVALVVPPFALPFLYFQWRLARLRYAEQHIRARKRRWMNYFVSQLTAESAVPETKHLDLGPLLMERFRSFLREFRDRDRELHRRNFAGSSIAAALTVAALYGVFIRVGVRVVGGSLTLGDLAIFVVAPARLRVSLDAFLRSLTVAGEQMLFASDLHEFLAERPRLPSGAALEPTSDKGRMEFRNVSFAYPGTGTPVLQNLTLTVGAGETLAIVGENGAGKSTLVKLITRMYDPDDGCILYDGVDLRDIDPTWLRDRIGLVLQSFGRYQASVHDNIAYGDWRRLLEDRAAVEALAKRIGIHDMIERLPDGYDTALGRSFGHYTLSGGQWQKIAVARALARDHSVLVLDEPTSNLDARSEHELFLKFKELSRGRTTILISHRFTTIGMADRIAVMAEGRIVELGSHAELVAQGGLYRTLHGFYASRSPGSAAAHAGPG